MITVVLIGTGNVAKHLFDAFSKTDKVTVVQVAGRNPAALKYFGNAATDLGTIANADVYIVSVSDDSVASVSQLLVAKKGVVVHTSGSISLNALSPNYNTGVFYPLQTFSKEREVDFTPIPICVEADSEQGLKLLEDLGRTISDKVYSIGSKEREILHLAAVFANNFTNHLYHMASEICEEHQAPFDLLKPLILETAKKIQDNRPFAMQTGPARRHDSKIIEKHLKRLQNGKQKELYALLSESIQETYI